MSHLHHTFKEPEIRIDNAALEAWKNDQLANAEALLTAAIPQSHDTRCHVLASRALVRTRLREWDLAIVDAEEVFPALSSHTQTLMLVIPSLSRSDHPLLRTLQSVWPLSARGKGTKDIRRATLRLSISTQLTLLFSFCSRCVSHFLALRCPLVSRLRQLSCSWMESMTMRYHVWTILSRPYSSTQHSMSSWRVHDVLIYCSITTDVPLGIYVSFSWELTYGEW